MAPDPDPGDVMRVSDDETVIVYVSTDPSGEPNTYDSVTAKRDGWLVAVAVGETWFRHKGEKWAYVGTNGLVQFERDDGVIPDLEDELGGLSLEDFGAMVESGELKPARPPDLPNMQ